MESLDLLKYEEELAKNLSEGNKRKLCIALNLIVPPPLFIMDEAFTAVDSLGKHEIYSLIK